MRWPERSFIASERHGFLYMPIEKVACSSIKHWIIKIVAGEETPEVHDYARENLELQTLPVHESERLLRDPSLFRFAFVRNPWDRLVSAFTNKFIPNKSPAQRFLSEMTWRRHWRSVLSWVTAGLVAAPDEVNPPWISTQPIAEQFTFRQFVGELEQLSPETFDQHWRPQYLSLGDQKLDFLGKFESLSEDFAQICRRLKIDYALPHKNQTPRRAVESTCVADWPAARLAQLGSYPDYRQFYTDDLIQRVGKVFQEDVTRFAYDFHSSEASLHAA